MKTTQECASLAGIFQQSADGVSFSVTVQPRSSRCSLEGVQGSSLKIRLTRPPVDGEANEECCRFIAGLLGIAKSKICVLRGAASRHKLLAASGISSDAAVDRITVALRSSIRGR